MFFCDGLLEPVSYSVTKPGNLRRPKRWLLTLTAQSELGRSCVTVEAAVLGSIPVPNSLYGLCGREAPLEVVLFWRANGD